MRGTSLLAIVLIALAGSSAAAQGLGEYKYQSRSGIQVGRGGYSDVTSPRSSGGYQNFNRLDNYRHDYDRHDYDRHDHAHFHPGKKYRDRGYRPGFGYWGGTNFSIGIGLPPAYGGYYYNSFTYPLYGHSSLFPYQTYYRPGDQYLEYVLPPVQPAELQYGPGAVKQFLGLPRDFANSPTVPLTDFDLYKTPLVIPSPLKVEPARIAQPSDQSIKRADAFIISGDALFRQQRFQEALGRYKDAVAAAPGYATAHLRKGLAYLATNRPDEAVESFERSVIQDPAVVHVPITLDQLLGGNQLAKESLIEAIARRAVANPQDGDLLFAVGVLLYFDETPESIASAAKMLRAAKREIGGDAPHVDAFLNEIEAARPVANGLDL